MKKKIGRNQGTIKVISFSKVFKKFNRGIY